MQLTVHAILRLQERFPKLFHDFGFKEPLLEYGRITKHNADLFRQLIQQSQKVDTVHNNLGQLIAMSERHGKLCDFYLYKNVVLVAAGNAIVTVYPQDWALRHVKNTSFKEEKPVLTSHDLLQLASKNIDKCRPTVVGKWDDSTYILQIQNDKGNITEYVKQDTTQKHLVEPFAPHEYDRLDRILLLNDLLKQGSAEEVFQLYDPLIDKNGGTYYFMEHRKLPFFAFKKKNSSHIHFLDYAHDDAERIQELTQFYKTTKSILKQEPDLMYDNYGFYFRDKECFVVHKGQFLTSYDMRHPSYFQNFLYHLQTMAHANPSHTTITGWKTMQKEAQFKNVAQKLSIMLDLQQYQAQPSMNHKFMYYLEHSELPFFVMGQKKQTSQFKELTPEMIEVVHPEEHAWMKAAYSLSHSELSQKGTFLGGGQSAQYYALSLAGITRVLNLEPNQLPFTIGKGFIKTPDVVPNIEAFLDGLRSYPIHKIEALGGENLEHIIFQANVPKTCHKFFSDKNPEHYMYYNSIAGTLHCIPDADLPGVAKAIERNTRLIQCLLHGQAEVTAIEATEQTHAERLSFQYNGQLIQGYLWKQNTLIIPSESPGLELQNGA